MVYGWCIGKRGKQCTQKNHGTNQQSVSQPWPYQPANYQRKNSFEKYIFLFLFFFSNQINICATARRRNNRVNGGGKGAAAPERSSQPASQLAYINGGKNNKKKQNNNPMGGWCPIHGLFCLHMNQKGKKIFSIS